MRFPFAGSLIGSLMFSDGSVITTCGGMRWGEGQGNWREMGSGFRVQIT